MKEWMRLLAEKQRTMREAHPKDDLMIVFDIDDTILDLRHMVLNVLQSFDRRQGTCFFQGLTIRDVGTSERSIHKMLEEHVPLEADAFRIIEWFRNHSWSLTVVRDAHRPFPGAMDVIRWLQTQHRTFVGLNTGRPECVRRETLQCLHDLGRPHGAAFADILLFMNPHGWGERVTESKVEGIRYFQDLRYRVVAFIDNEPENLRAVEEYDTSGEILLLHADTIFEGKRENVPGKAVSGRIYDVTEFGRNEGVEDGLGRAA
jgi:FMN phosphatase YigB (HAD superfamily)